MQSWLFPLESTVNCDGHRSHDLHDAELDGPGDSAAAMKKPPGRMERWQEDPGENGPKGPCFVIGDRGYLDFDEHFSSVSKATLSWAIGIGRRIYTVYDANGHRWDLEHVKSAYQRRWWLVLLASTVFNPTIPVTFHWREPTEYSLEELRKAFSKAIEEDDDILTQFAEAQEINQRVSSTRSFTELAEVYRWMQTEHLNDDEDAD